MVVTSIKDKSLLSGYEQVSDRSPDPTLITDTVSFSKEQFEIFLKADSYKSNSYTIKIIIILIQSRGNTQAT